MDSENKIANSTLNHIQPLQEVVNLPYRVYQSFKGRYFIGHTPLLTIGNHLGAWGGLINPPGSGVNLYLNTFTVSNTSSIPFQAQLWINTKPYGKASISPHVSPGNTTIDPLPKSNTVLAFAYHLKDSPPTGSSLFNRIAEANSTVVGNYLGKIIVPPGGSVILYLQAPDAHSLKTEIALGWWEEPKNHPHKNTSKAKCD